MTTTGRMMESQRDEIIAMLKADGTSEESIAAFSSFADHWQYQINELAASGRAIERLMGEFGFNWMRYFNRYMELHMEESMRYSGDYLCEDDRKELLEEAESLTSLGDADE